ncbi:AUGMIN subunit 6 [Phalaenopsis equestris]|uniref:AUGMIN subunit 6 n=1 Tax=Phalaenopsis equestris TaxID=78828 RepID=UPI0009E3F959|nr:AUGMIN subunit 6 [Phalaenopsis equestris]
MATDREKEREAELESAMYTNCLLLGLDPAIIGVGGAGGSPRVGHFRHSNPRLGEKLLYFLLSSLRGPVQSAKDFDKVWPIYDSAQSRDFRKIVQGIISELESQGALPRSNARVSSLATCCGPRFVELLWQLSVHALREVHSRTFAADVASNPLPASLTDASYLHAAALLPVTKARIALERRKFLKNASIAVHRQAAWSNLANEMTAEFRALCAEEAYLQQELEKLQDLRNKAKLDGELWDDHISTSSQNAHLVSKATRLWESLLSRKSQHEVLASGPIEDLIAHREHRYRISGSSLLAAMESGSYVSYPDLLSAHASELSSSTDACEKVGYSQIPAKTDILSKTDDRGVRVHQIVDVAEVIRRWTHALQRIHKQSLHLAKANDGEGPELLRSTFDDGTGGHAESLAATLAEHRQHLVSIQGLINQLKDAVPVMQKSIADLTEEVNRISPIALDEYNERLSSPTQARSSGRIQENTDQLAEMASNLSLQSGKVSGSPLLKLPHLFSLTPNSSGKSMHSGKRHATAAPPAAKSENILAVKSVGQPFGNDCEEVAAEDGVLYALNIRLAVREAALSGPSSNSEVSDEKSSDESEHFFVPLSTSLPGKEADAVISHRKQPPFSPDNGECIDQVFSPPFVMNDSFFEDSYEDLLAPLSETDAALMGSPSWLEGNSSNASG